jgi:hypothetical protein
MRHLRHRDLDGLARGRLDHTKDALALGITPGSKPEHVFTADNTTNTITVAGEDDLAVGNPRVILEGSLPAELETGTIYWLADTGTNTYSLHASKAEAAAGTGDIAFTDDGTGTLTMTILD